MNKKVRLQLVGLDSNAFSIIGAWKRAARQQGWSSADIDRVLAEAMNGDYHHLLATIVSYTEDIDEEDDGNHGDGDNSDDDQDDDDDEENN